MRRKEDCDKCKGKGYVVIDGQRAQCKECDGDGEVCGRTGEPSDLCRCPDCEEERGRR